LGNLLQNDRQLDHAIAEYQQALRLNPGLGRAQVDLATALAEKGDVDGAVEQLHRAANSPDPLVRQRALEVLKLLGRP
jgi:tetratricopeptide (TPR) repeat protein